MAVAVRSHRARVDGAASRSIDSGTLRDRASSSASWRADRASVNMHRGRLGQVQLETSATPAMGHLGSHVNHQPFLLFQRQRSITGIRRNPRREGSRSRRRARHRRSGHRESNRYRRRARHHRSGHREPNRYRRRDRHHRSVHREPNRRRGHQERAAVPAAHSRWSSWSLSSSWWWSARFRRRHTRLPTSVRPRCRRPPSSSWFAVSSGLTLLSSMPLTFTRGLCEQNLAWCSPRLLHRRRACAETGFRRACRPGTPSPVRGHPPLAQQIGYTVTEPPRSISRIRSLRPRRFISSRKSDSGDANAV